MAKSIERRKSRMGNNSIQHLNKTKRNGPTYIPCQIERYQGTNRITGTLSDKLGSDPFRIYYRIRTKAKTMYHCVGCSSTENIEMHHRKTIKSTKEKDKRLSFGDKIDSHLRRLQIPLCRRSLPHQRSLQH